MPLDKYHFILKNLISRIEVFKSGLVDGPVQVSSFNRVIGSSWSISILKKIQNNVVLEKKTKINGLQPDFWPVFTGSTGSVESWLFLFFLQPDQIPAPNRAGFQNYIKNDLFLFTLFFFYVN